MSHSRHDFDARTEKSRAAGAGARACAGAAWAGPQPPCGLEPHRDRAAPAGGVFRHGAGLRGRPLHRGTVPHPARRIAGAFKTSMPARTLPRWSSLSSKYADAFAGLPFPWSRNLICTFVLLR